MPKNCGLPWSAIGLSYNCASYWRRSILKTLQEAEFTLEFYCCNRIQFAAWFLSCYDIFVSFYCKIVKYIVALQSKTAVFGTAFMQIEGAACKAAVLCHHTMFSLSTRSCHDGIRCSEIQLCTSACCLFFSSFLNGISYMPSSVCPSVSVNICANRFFSQAHMALNSLLCAHVPLRNCSLSGPWLDCDEALLQ